MAYGESNDRWSWSMTSRDPRRCARPCRGCVLRLLFLVIPVTVVFTYIWDIKPGGQSVMVVHPQLRCSDVCESTCTPPPPPSSLPAPGVLPPSARDPPSAGAHPPMAKPSSAAADSDVLATTEASGLQGANINSRLTNSVNNWWVWSADLCTDTFCVNYLQTLCLSQQVQRLNF